MAGLQFRTDPHKDRFFALRTFRRDGSAKSTPIWFAPANGRWYAVTPGRSWKVRRIRHNDRVGVAAATFHGEPLGRWHSGRARVLPRAELCTAARAMTAKYGNQFHLFRLMLLIGASRQYGGPAVGLEITLDEGPRAAGGREYGA
nr:PPOX class F420-dependent oxidoreductase [Spelaeicoccus albus]